MTDQPKLMRRRSIRVGELRDIVKRQGDKREREYLVDAFTKSDCIEWINGFGKCDYSGEPINGQDFDFDHKIPNAMLYEGDEITWEIVLRKWHKVKTSKDVKDIAKAKRMGGEKGQYARRKKRGKSLINSSPTIQSRGFQKKGERYDNTKYLD